MGQVTNLHFKNVEARRLQKIEPKPVQVRIDNNLAVNQIRAVAAETCQVEFSYTAAYGPLGFVKIDGEFTYTGPLAAQCSKDWEAKRQMPQEAAGEIHTTIMHACIPEAVTLARAIQLPPPIPLPSVKFEKQGAAAQTGTAHHAGPEIQ